MLTYVPQNGHDELANAAIPGHYKYAYSSSSN